MFLISVPFFIFYNYSMTLEINSEKIVEITSECGFQLCNVTDLSAPVEVEYFKKWLESGYHGDMKYLENPDSINFRSTPLSFSSASKSVLVLGARYPYNPLEILPVGLFGRISSYSWGIDYHLVLQKFSEKLLNKLETFTGNPISSRIAIDSSPVLEKPLGVRAGLGWQGKNSCLINPTHGSFFFLANLFSSINTQQNTTLIPHRCGTCHRCIDACPTGCILPGHMINASRCISYHTIENKGSIPKDIRSAMGDWLFGCDICQSVCPWNKKLNNADIRFEFLPQDSEGMFINLEKLIQLTDQEFKQKYKNSPLLRAKRRGLLRNAAIVLGNSKDDAALQVLGNLLKYEIEPLVRAHAAWALGQNSSRKSQEFLSDQLLTENDPQVLEEINYALAMN
jgi:epoxyqueuosine reductase